MTGLPVRPTVPGNSRMWGAYTPTGARYAIICRTATEMRESIGTGYVRGWPEARMLGWRVIPVEVQFPERPA